VNLADLLILAIILSPLFALFGFVLFGPVHSRRAQRIERHAWSRAAKELGLELAPDQLSMIGRIDRRTIAVDSRMGTTTIFVSTEPSLPWAPLFALTPRRFRALDDGIESNPASSHEIAHEVRRLIEAAERAEEDARSLPAKLAERFRTQALAETRVGALRTLRRYFLDSHEAAEVTLEALDDAQPEVAYAAASDLDDHVRLGAIACVEDAKDELRTAALRNAIKGLGDGSRNDLIERTLSAGSVAVRATAAGLCTMPATEKQIEILSTLAKEGSIPAIRALGRLRIEAAEPIVIESLSSSSAAQREAAARALAAIGTVHALTALMRAAFEADGDPELRKLIEGAAAAIRERAGEAEHGQLSLAEVSGAALSFPPAESGALSFDPRAPDREGSR
jgi:hypothetical protein